MVLRFQGFEVGGCGGQGVGVWGLGRQVHGEGFWVRGFRAWEVVWGFGVQIRGCIQGLEGGVGVWGTDKRVHGGVFGLGWA